MPALVINSFFIFSFLSFVKFCCCVFLKTIFLAPFCISRRFVWLGRCHGVEASLAAASEPGERAGQVLGNLIIWKFFKTFCLMSFLRFASFLAIFFLGVYFRSRKLFYHFS